MGHHQLAIGRLDATLERDLARGGVGQGAGGLATDGGDVLPFQAQGHADLAARQGQQGTVGLEGEVVKGDVTGRVGDAVEDVLDRRRVVRVCQRR